MPQATRASCTASLDCRAARTLKPVLLLTGNTLTGLALLCAALLRENPRSSGETPAATRSRCANWSGSAFHACS